MLIFIVLKFRLSFLTSIQCFLFNVPHLRTYGIVRIARAFEMCACMQAYLSPSKPQAKRKKPKFTVINEIWYKKLIISFVSLQVKEYMM